MEFYGPVYNLLVQVEPATAFFPVVAHWLKPDRGISVSGPYGRNHECCSPLHGATFYVPYMEKPLHLILLKIGGGKIAISHMSLEKVGEGGVGLPCTPMLSLLLMSITSYKAL